MGSKRKDKIPFPRLTPEQMEGVDRLLDAAYRTFELRKENALPFVIGGRREMDGEYRYAKNACSVISWIAAVAHQKFDPVNTPAVVPDDQPKRKRKPRKGK